MSNSESRVMNSSLLVKAGIPAVISIAAYICSKIVSKRIETSNPSSSIIDPAEQDCNNSTVFDDYQHEGHNSRGNLEVKLLELEILVEHLQRKERDLKARFLKYQVMKQRELMLMEMRNKLILEKTRAEVLIQEIYLVQNESQRMGSFILEYIKVIQKLEDSKKENGLLERKARKLCKRGRQRLKIIREMKLRIEAKDEKILSNEEELQRKDELIQELEDEISQMKEVIDHLQREKLEISNNIDIHEKPYSLNHKEEIEGVTKEEHEKVLKELEKLEKDLETKANEVTYLKWSNACLRHELLRFHQQNKQEENDQHVESDECVCNTTGTSSSNYEQFSVCLCTNNNIQHPSRRKRFIQKVKKWVEGGKMDDIKDKEIHLEADNLLVHPRNSCSSV
ncbi:unnamed protein product [Amaranthus hypochondriacus]